MKHRGVASLLFVALLGHPCPAQTPTDQSEHAGRRIGLSGGLGVSYVSAPDVVNLINASGGQSERASEFKAGAEFFGTLSIPLSEDWGVKVEYAYLILSYSPPVSSLGATDFSVAVHMPTVLGQYTLVDGGTYDVKAGAGAGYHFGSVTEKFVNLEDRYSGKGLGAVLDLEANSAFGEHVYGYFGGNLRWDFIGTLTNEVGRTARLVSSGSDPTLEFFSVGARLGFTYYF